MQSHSVSRSALLREREVLQCFLPVSKSTLWVMVRRGDFPKPMKISAGVTVWRLGDIQDWLESHGGNNHE